MKHTVLHDTGRFNISSYRDYHYFHHWTGYSIAVLPVVLPGAKIENVSIQRVPQRLLTGDHQGFVGLRKEDLPCWQADLQFDDLQWTCVTGGSDGKETDEQCMRRELREEMGLELLDHSFIKTAPMHTGKGSNLQVTHFVVTVHSAIIHDIKPDSVFEAAAENVWLPFFTARTYLEKFDLHTNHLLRMAKVVQAFDEVLL